MWLWPVVYFSLGFFNILFAWLGIVEFMLPLLFAVFGGNKYFCNKLCGKGQLFALLKKTGNPAPRWVSSRVFRYAFLAFFMVMFANVIYQTWLVYGGVRSLHETVRVMWAFSVPFGWAYTAGTTSEWIAQFSFGLYGLMLTSEIIGLVVMMVWRPRTWCTFCPMGTMTQIICELKARKNKKDDEARRK